MSRPLSYSGGAGPELRLFSLLDLVDCRSLETSSTHPLISHGGLTLSGPRNTVGPFHRCLSSSIQAFARVRSFVHQRPRNPHCHCEHPRGGQQPLRQAVSDIFCTVFFFPLYVAKFELDEFPCHRPCSYMASSLIECDWILACLPYNDAWRVSRRLLAKYFSRSSTGSRTSVVGFTDFEWQRPHVVKYTRYFLRNLLQKPDSFMEHTFR